MRNDQAIIADDKLDTGMSAREAVQRAAVWWDAIGRKMIRDVPGIDPVMRDVSPMLRGELFDVLTKREKLRVVKVWHHFKIRRGDVLDVSPDAPFKLGGKEVVQ